MCALFDLENNARNWKEAAAASQAETQCASFGSLKEKESMESEREQVIWRLQRLLGDQCDKDRMMEGAGQPSESICTEDFVQCFREEMVELQPLDHHSQQRQHASQVQKSLEVEKPKEPKKLLSNNYRAKTSEEAENRGSLEVNTLESSKFYFSQI